jgi:hypothetical protein
MARHARVVLREDLTPQGKAIQNSEFETEVDDRLYYVSEFMDGIDAGRVAAWSTVPVLQWSTVVESAHRRMAGARRKLGELELDVLLEQIADAHAPRLTLDLRPIADPDDLKTSELHALGPALQRALQALDQGSLVAYRISAPDVAQALADQFTLHSVPARDGAPARPLLGLGLLDEGPRVLGPLPRYLEDAFALVVDRGLLTAVDLNELRGVPLATASDYLGELHRLRVALREREALPGGGSRFVYTVGA